MKIKTICVCRCPNYAAGLRKQPASDTEEDTRTPIWREWSQVQEEEGREKGKLEDMWPWKCTGEKLNTELQDLGNEGWAIRQKRGSSKTISELHWVWCMEYFKRKCIQSLMFLRFFQKLTAFKRTAKIGTSGPDDMCQIPLIHGPKTGYTNVH